MTVCPYYCHVTVYLVVTVLLEDVPSQVAHRESLIAELTLHLLPVLGQDVLVQGRHLLTTDMTRLLGTVPSRAGHRLQLNVALLQLS